MPDVRVLTRHLGLLRQHDYRHLWIADAVSELGTRITFLALPLLAVTDLHASTLQVALLRTAQTIAYLVLGLQIGAWCDRLRRRPVVVAADLGRAALFAWIPLAAALHVLTVGQLYVVVGAAGVLSVFFAVAIGAYLPTLVAEADLLEGNTKLATNASVAAIVAPTVAGGLVQWLGAPAAIAVDAASYAWSGLWLRGIHAREPRPARTQRHLRREIGEGLRLVFGHPLLRAFGLHGTCLSLCQSANIAILVVFLVRDVHLSPVVIGALSATGLLGALLGSAVTGWLTRTFGSARTLLVTALLGGAGFLLYPLTSPGWAIGCTAAGTFTASFSVIVGNIVQTSYQQAVCPPLLRGRMNATLAFLVWGAMPAGALLGGVAGSVLGLRATLWLAGAGALASVAWLVCSPLRSARDLPVNDSDTPTAGHG